MWFVNNFVCIVFEPHPRAMQIFSYETIVPSGFTVILHNNVFWFCFTARLFAFVCVNVPLLTRSILGCCVSDEEIKVEEPLKQITPGWQHTCHAHTHTKNVIGLELKSLLFSGELKIEKV